MSGKVCIQANTETIDAELKSKYPEQLFIKLLVNQKRAVDVHIKTCSGYNFINTRFANQLGVQLVSTKKKVKSLSNHVTKYRSKCYVNIVVPGLLNIADVECVVRDSTDDITLGHNFFRNFEFVTLAYGGPLGKVLAYHHDHTSKIDVMIDSVLVEKAHIYSASRQSLISLKFATKMKLALCEAGGIQLRSAGQPVRHVTSITSLPPSNSEPDMVCFVKLYVGPNLHDQFKFVVVKNLTVDVALGADFLVKHEAVKIRYGGSLPPLKLVNCQPQRPHVSGMPRV